MTFFNAIHERFSSKVVKRSFYFYTLCILFVSTLPINGNNSSVNNIFILSLRLDYLLHFVIYIPWYFLLWKVTRRYTVKSIVNTVYLLITGILFAAAMEAIQYFLTYRSFNINDLLANIFGIVIGFFLIIFIQILRSLQ